MTTDRELLQKFLQGELAADEIDALEERLDHEPELQAQLGALAVEVYEDELPCQGTTRMSLFCSRVATVAPIATGITLGDVIGKGGMGIVQRAVQRSLHRTVAVKTLRVPERDRDLLVQEAQLTGYLEHPNIVPVHDISTDDEGQPQVVLKLIEGTVWRDTFTQRGQAPGHPLEWHVRVLIQVCQALRFAHSRGIIHRDIKPSNVMIGEFDEVYLLDWGLAVCLDEEADLPNLADTRGIAGTPAYMAPEQLDEDSDGLGVHTDIYLVGACLYHVAGGRPPHKGRNLAEIRSARLAQVGLDIPEHVPAELARIIECAMATNPSDRFATMAELRDALDLFLEHRAAAALAQHGDEMAEQMTIAHGDNDAVAAERAFFDAAFNYRAAQESWQGNTELDAKLDALVHARVEQLIALNAPTAARRALAIVQSADPALHARVDEAVAKHDEDQIRLRNYDRGDDRGFGLRTRRLAGLFAGGLWIALNLVVVGLPVTTALPLLIGAVACLVISVVILVRARRVMLDVRLNRYIAAIALVAQVAQVVQLGLAASMNRPVVETLVELMLLWSVAAASTAVVIDARILPTALGYLAAYVACRLDPSLLTYALPAGATVMLVTSHTINVITQRGLARQSVAQPDGYET